MIKANFLVFAKPFFANCPEQGQIGVHISQILVTFDVFHINLKEATVCVLIECFFYLPTQVVICSFIEFFNIGQRTFLVNWDLIPFFNPTKDAL